MSSATSPKVCYVVYLPHSNKAQSFPFYIEEGAKVDDLREAIRKHPDFKRHLKDESIILLSLKCDDLGRGPFDSRYGRAMDWLRKHGTIRETMDAADRLKEYFPNGPAPEESKAIDVLVLTDSILESRDALTALPDALASKLIKDRYAVVDIMGKFPSPSEGVRSEEKIRGWAGERTGVHPHRPTGNYGPPTALFHPALARLRHRLMHIDDLDDIEEPSADYLMWSHKFIIVCGNEFGSEPLRQEAVKQIINILLDEGEWQKQLDGGTATPDAVWGRRDFIWSIFELKNVDGLGGNASLQSLLVLAKILAQPKYQVYVPHSNFPVILIGLMGSRLEISTAIFTDGIYTDKLLAEEFSIDAWQSNTVLRVGRIFKALSLAIAELRNHYQTLAHHRDTEPTISHLYPNPLPVDKSTSIPRLDYLGKLSHAGELLLEKTMHERPYALYRAKMHRDKTGDEIDVVVKFTVRYHEKAHQILAENQLAPTLHCCIPLVGDMFMVIMDYIESAPLSFVREPQGCERIYSDVEAAIKQLHEQDLVFSDLRVENIVPKPGGGAMLIDFDWAGKHLVDRYPASWNNSNTLAPGVDRRTLLDKAHDIFMLKTLRRFLQL